MLQLRPELLGSFSLRTAKLAIMVVQAVSVKVPTIRAVAVAAQVDRTVRATLVLTAIHQLTVKVEQAGKVTVRRAAQGVRGEMRATGSQAPQMLLAAAVAAEMMTLFRAVLEERLVAVVAVVKVLVV